LGSVEKVIALAQRNEMDAVYSILGIKRSAALCCTLGVYEFLVTTHRLEIEDAA
jgi:hypothetical protein